MKSLTSFTQDIPVKEIPVQEPVITPITGSIIEDNINIPITEKPVIGEHMMSDSNFVGYDSLELQEHTYKLASFGILSSNTKSVIDLGCGRGDFGHFIKTTINPDALYTGIDVNKLMIDIAKEKYGNRFTDNIFIHTNYYDLNPAEHSPAEWVFNITNLTIPYGFHSGDKMNQFRDLLNISLHLCTVGTVFILLNDRTEYSGFYQYNTGDVVRYLEDLGLQYCIDNTDTKDIFKLVILKPQI